MKLKIFSIVTFFALLAVQTAFGQASNVYIIQENIRVAGVTTDAQIDALSVTSKQTTYQYFDGLFRPLQTVGLKATPLQKDLIQPMAYDNLGRQTTSYLPYTDGSADGSYRYNAVSTGQPVFYSPTTTNNLIARDGSPFTSQVFENSPLQRLLNSGTVGDGFQPGGTGTQHYKTVSYRGNTSAADGNIFVWNPDGTYIPGTLYGDNSLSVVDGKDEDNIETLSFTDRAGHIILKRQVHTGGNLDTYYVYNAAGMLSYIIPPKATALLAANSYSITTAPLNTLVFSVTYDGRGRIASKTVAAKGTMYMVYDAWNRVVLMQDANMKANNKWNYVKYDAKGRAISQGIYVDATHTTQAGMQTYVNTFTTAWYESRSGSASNGGYYSNTAFPTTGITPLAYAYFDDYDLNQDGTDDFAYITQSDANLPNEASATTAKLKGAPTIISKTTIGLGIAANTWLTKAVFYDKRGNTIQEQSNNHVYNTGATTFTDTKTVVPDFAGMPQTTKVVKKTATSTTVTVYTALTYDHMYRVATVSQKYNTGAMQQIAAYSYNELGQLINKGLGVLGSGTIPTDLTLSGTYSGTNTEIATHSITFSSSPATIIPSGAIFKAFISPGYLQSVDYRYNIRGQLLSMNNSKLSNDGGVTNDDDTDLFGMQFLYDKVDANVGNTAWFNGKLSAVKWMSKDASGTSSYERSYKYNYDDIDRYTAANYAERAATGTGTFSNNVGGFDESGITYDANGNILTLNRNSSTQGTNTNTQIDNLTYTYDATNPNQLLKVSDGTGANYTGYGFRNLTGVTSTSYYTYDVNGNLVGDPYKGISLTYNDLNRTNKITVTTATNRYINYTYDAGGAILRKQAYDNNVLQTTTDYVDGFVYTTAGAGTAILSYFGMPEGRVRNTGTALKPEYIISDQQGNARISFEESATSPGTAVVRQENSYYAFGLVMPNSPVSTPTTDNKQLYNGGSEWQNDYSNLPDYYQTFYRNYDAALGRFVGVDPMAEATESLSTYHYAGNNPVVYNDPLGNYQYTPHQNGGGGNDGFSNPHIPKMGSDGVLYWDGLSIAQEFGFDDSSGGDGGGSGGSASGAGSASGGGSTLPPPPGSDAFIALLSNPDWVNGLRGAKSIDLSHDADYNIYKNGDVRVQRYGTGYGDDIDWQGSDSYTTKSSASQEGCCKTHAAELAKYGYVVGGMNVAGTLSLGAGGTIEFGFVRTNKNYIQYYRTVYYTSTAAAAISVNGFLVTNKGSNKTTFSDWAGPIFGGAVNYYMGSGVYGTSSTYNQWGGGVGAGLSFKLFGSGSVGWTTLMGSPIYDPPVNLPRMPQDYPAL